MRKKTIPEGFSAAVWNRGVKLTWKTGDKPMSREALLESWAKIDRAAQRILGEAPKTVPSKVL